MAARNSRSNRKSVIFAIVNGKTSVATAMECGANFVLGMRPLAVHFCSIQCKDEYMTKLFGSTPAEEVVVETTAPASGDVVIEREIPSRETIVTKTRRVHRRKAA